MAGVTPERAAVLRKKVAEAGSKDNYVKSVKDAKVSKKTRKDEQSKTLATVKQSVESAERRQASNPNDETAKKDLEAQNEEMKKLESEIKTGDDVIMDWEQEEKDIESMDWETDAPVDLSSNGNASPPVPPTVPPGTAPPDPPVVPGTSQENPVSIDDDPEDLIIIDDFEDDRNGIKPTTVAWGHRGRGEVVINAYGPLNARIHRLEPGSDIFDREHVVNFSAAVNRLGEAKPDGYYIRRGHEVKTIQGVAFRGMDKLQNINPATHGPGAARYPETQVLLKWNIGGETKKSWETRSTIRRLWKNKANADKAIFEAATRAEKRHDEWKNGQREAKEKSPTPAPPDPPPEAPAIKQEITTPPAPSVAAAEKLTVPPSTTPSNSPAPDGVPNMTDFFKSLAQVKHQMSLEQFMDDDVKVMDATARYNKVVASRQSSA